MFRMTQVQPNQIYSYEEATRLVINEQIHRVFKPLEHEYGTTLNQK